ncbi:MAG: hypothetical protein CVU81_01990, partial [Euryarchaeota archaeon HGW-Euryarchaeota-1]
MPAKLSLDKLALKEWRLVLVIVLLLVSVYLINPNGAFGGGQKVIINGGSYAGQTMEAISSQPIKTIDEYNLAIDQIKQGDNVICIIDSQKKIISAPQNKSLGFNVSMTSARGLKFGLDIIGGTTVVVGFENPEKVQNGSEMMDRVYQVLDRRVNGAGLTDVQMVMLKEKDTYFLQISIAGATREDLEQMLLRQGQFEAKIGNETVFTGDQIMQIGYPTVTQTGNYQMPLTITHNAAENYAKILKTLNYSAEYREYLDKKIVLFLDGENVSELFIANELKRKGADDLMTTSIQGSGGKKDAAQMKSLLESGSLPVQIKIYSMQPYSAKSGGVFLNELLIALVGVFLSVGAIIYIRFRKIVDTLLVMVLLAAELVIILGIAALIHWNLDIASLVALLAIVGSGVDNLIIILSEVKAGEQTGRTINVRIERAFFIIYGSAFTTIAAMLLFTTGV